MGKVTLISDFVYGSIEISDFEKFVLSTRIFNRLHNVLQTSTAYLTYPTLRTTRFSHSIGAMHLAGGIFSNAFQNATSHDKEQFLISIKKEIDLLLIEVDIDPTQEFNYPWQILSCEFLQNSLPNGPVFQKNNAFLYAYLVVFQAVRISALIHDIGHPPFSHVVERFYQQLKKDYREESFSGKQIHAIFKKFDDEKPLHEQLGDFLTQAIFAEIFTECSNQSDLHDQTFIKVVAKFSQKITNAGAQSNPIFSALHSIVASDLDADRMDYVSRDYFISGLVGSPIRYDRLISSYTLKCKEGFSGFYPSVRALNTLENYFQSRFNLYKHALYHHRVAKTDALLEYCLSAIVKRWINKQNSISQEPQEYYLKVDVENLWKVLAYDPLVDSLEVFIDRLSQWDDAWMLSLLRKEYFELIKKQNQNQLSPDEKILIKRLAELLSNHKNYYSLYKRFDSMLEFEEAVCETYRLGCADNFKNLDQLREPEMVEKIISLLKKSVIQKEIIEKTDIIDTMIVKKKLNAGISDQNEFLLVKDESLVALDKISSLRSELNESIKLMPQYYIFVLFKDGKQPPESMNELRKKIGNIVGKHLK